MLARGRIDPALYRNGQQFALAEYLASQHRQPGDLNRSRPSVTTYSTLAGALDEPKPASPTQDIPRASTLTSTSNAPAAPPPPHPIPVAAIPIRGRQPSDDYHRWACLTPSSLSSSPSIGWTTDATSPAWSDLSSFDAPSPACFERAPSIGYEQVSRSLPSQRNLPSCFTTEPLSRSLSSSSAPILQAPSRREKRSTRKPSPYRVATESKEDVPRPDLEAWYDALVEEAIKNPANKHYRREVIERSVRGADYRPKTKVRIRKQGDASDRPTCKKSRKRSDAHPTTATTSHALTRRSEHDQMGHLPQRQVAEGQPPVHRSELLELIDNRGHSVSGIAQGSSDPYSVCAAEQGTECNAFGDLDNTPTQPYWNIYGQPSDLVALSSTPQVALVQPDVVQNEDTRSWTDTNFNLFGTPGSATTTDVWNLSTSPSIGAFDPVETTWSW